MLDLFTLLVFFFVLVGVYALRAVSSRTRRREEADAHLQQLAQEIMGTVGAKHQMKAAESVLLGQDDYQGRFPRLHARIKSFQRGMDMLGWKKNFRLRVGITVLVSLIAGGLVGRMTPYMVPVTLAIAVPVFILIVAVAYWRAMDAWVTQMAAMLPEAVDSIARIVRAGIPAATAFGFAAQSLSGPLAQELLSIDRWLKLGVPLKQVLQESAQRVPLAEWRLFAVILIISQESGGKLADTLVQLAQTLRDRAELQLKVQGRTSEARASIKIVASLVPCVLAYTYWRAPGDFHFLVTDPTGIKVLAYAAASVGLGLFITWLMVRRVQ